MSAEAADTRRCRTCGESYAYPAHKSLATGSACESCLEISPATRRVLQLFRRRLDQLDKALEGLSRAAQSG